MQMKRIFDRGQKPISH